MDYDQGFRSNKESILEYLERRSTIRTGSRKHSRHGPSHRGSSWVANELVNQEEESEMYDRRPYLSQRVARLTVQNSEIFYNEQDRTNIDRKIEELYIIMHENLEAKTRDIEYCPNYFSETPQTSFKMYLYKILHDENYDSYGMVIYVIILSITLLSLVCTVLESLPSLRQKTELWDTIEIYVTIIFTIEYCSRVYVVKNRLQYCGETLNLFDLFAIIPFYVNLVVGQEFPGNGVLRALRLARITRIRMFTSPIMNILKYAISSSSKMLRTLLILITITVLVAGTLLFEVEMLTHESITFKSIPDAMYFTFISMTTVGYGDVVVQNELSKVLVMVAILVGCLMNAVCIMAIGQNFINAYDCYQKEINELTDFFIEKGMITHTCDKFADHVTVQQLYNMVVNNKNLNRYSNMNAVEDAAEEEEEEEASGDESASLLEDLKRKSRSSHSSKTEKNTFRTAQRSSIRRSPEHSSYSSYNRPRLDSPLETLAQKEKEP